MFSGRIICQKWQRFPLTSSKFPVKTNFVNHFKTKASGTKLKPNPPPAETQGLTPFPNVSNAAGEVPASNITKAFFFTVAFSGGCYAGATILQYESFRNKWVSRMEKSKVSSFIKKFKGETSVQDSQFVREVKKFWNQLTPGEKVFAPICALNLIVFGLWRLPRFQGPMMKYFCSNPASRAVCWPMFLSTFSHYSAFHIFANMYVLHSFSSAACMSLGQEQFLGLYLAAGVISSFSSYVFKAMTTTAGLSLGASGAIMTILAYVCTKHPDTQLGILFLPMLTFSAGTAIKVIMGIDFAGCLLGWKFFDHAAHLGGALFGVYWAYFGRDVWALREGILKYYHQIRSGSQK